MAGYRPPYTREEEKKILQYIIDNEAYCSLRGDRLYKEMENAKIIDRTWQSIKNHFKRFLIRQLDIYGLPEDKITLVREGWLLNQKKPQKKEEDYVSLLDIKD